MGNSPGEIRGQTCAGDRALGGTSIKEGALLALADLELTEICLPVLGHGKFLTSNITEASLPFTVRCGPSCRGGGTEGS